MGTLMNQNFNKTKMPKAIDPKDQFHQIQSGLSLNAATPTKTTYLLQQTRRPYFGVWAETDEAFQMRILWVTQDAGIKGSTTTITTPYLWNHILFSWMTKSSRLLMLFLKIQSIANNSKTKRNLPECCDGSVEKISKVNCTVKKVPFCNL